MSNFETAQQILRTIVSHGHQAYFVGGFVRDQIRGAQTHDIDIATSATPAEVQAMFAHTVATGLQHGTVSVIVDRIAYEVTTFRTESSYENSRRPQEVTFIGDVYGDLERRDFTINAMAMDVDGRIIDPYAGQADIQAGIVRAVGQASARFDEDALRMLRCLRFAANLEFKIDSQTWQALKQQRHNLLHISIERVRMDLDKMMAGVNPQRALQLFANSGLYSHLKGDQRLGAAIERKKTAHQHQQLADESPLIVIDSNRMSDVRARWASWFLQLELTADDAKSVCRFLTHPNKKTEQITDIIRFSQRLLEQLQMTRTEHECAVMWKRLTLHYGTEIADLYLAVLANELHNMNHSPAQSIIDQQKTMIWHHAQQWMAQMPITHVRQLAINGHQLLKYSGRKHGPWIRQTIDYLLDQVALARINNDQHTLITAAQQLWEEDERATTDGTD